MFFHSNYSKISHSTLYEPFNVINLIQFPGAFHTFKPSL